MSKDFAAKVFDDINENEILKKLQLEYDVFDKIHFTEFTLKETIEMNPFWGEQFRLLMIKAKARLLELETARDLYVGELYNKLKFEDSRNLTKTEIERYYIPADKRYIVFQKSIMKQDIYVEFFEAIWDAFKSQSWLLKQFIEAEKL